MWCYLLIELFYLLLLLISKLEGLDKLGYFC